MARSIGTAVGRLIAVFDRPEEADAAIEALVADGVDRDRIDRLAGPDDAAAFDASGRHRGLAGRLYRIIEFTWADQAPDFAAYEAALRDGRQVLAIRLRGQDRIQRAAHRIAAANGHFINHFGWFETQEFSRWRGPEPDLPGFLRR